LEKERLIMFFQTIAVLVLLLLALLADRKTCRIPNKITIPFTAAGFLVNIALSGRDGFLFAAAGWLLPVIILFAFYALRMLGAGDIKLFGAVGAIFGYRFVWNGMLYSFLAGGVLAIFLLLTRRNAQARSKQLWEYLKNCMLMHRLQEYNDFKDGENDGLFRFSYAVVPGVLLQLLTFHLIG
jgi:prepilin peptidase CpaA